VEHRSSYAAAVDHVVEYAYDYANRWVYKRLDDDGDGHAEQRRIFIYDGNQIVMDFWRTNSGDMQVGHLRQRYLWGPAVDQILAEENVDNGADETVQWTLTDHLNTVRDIAKYNSGSDMTTVVNHLIYDAFGRVTSETNPAVDSLFLFTARPFDADTGLQNNLSRWYDAHVGRWLSEDPIGFAGGDGNLYRYVKNSPIVSTDPSGKGDEHSSDPNTTFLDAIEAANTVKDFLKEVADPTKPGSLTVLLDLPSNVLQEQLSKFLRALNEFQPQTDCARWYKRAVEAILAAHRGDGRMCPDIAARDASDRTLGDRCALDLVIRSGGSSSSALFCRFARRVSEACADLARKNIGKPWRG